MFNLCHRINAMRSQDLIEKRNEAIRSDFKKLFGKKHLQYAYCLTKLSQKYFLQPLTIERILKEPSTHSTDAQPNSQHRQHDPSEEF